MNSTFKLVVHICKDGGAGGGSEHLDPNLPRDVTEHEMRGKQGLVRCLGLPLWEMHCRCFFYNYIYISNYV